MKILFTLRLHSNFTSTPGWRRLRKNVLHATALLFAVLGVGQASLHATERLFVLQDSTHLGQYVVDNAGVVTLEKTYTPQELPQALPASFLEMKSGNILRTLGASYEQVGRVRYEVKSNQLLAYAGEAGSAAELVGKILEQPDLTQNFRGADSLYGEAKQGKYRAEVRLAEFRKVLGARYRDYFILDRQVFGIAGDHVDRVSGIEGKATETPERVLTIAGADLTAVATSPWNEVFVSDAGLNCLMRLVWRDGGVVVAGKIVGKTLVAPRALKFTSRGDLFVANGPGRAPSIARFGFTLYDFTNWQAAEKPGIELAGAGALDLAVSRPIGYVISEKVQPLGKTNVDPATGHHGISKQVFISPQTNSETAVVALVEYGPGGHTIVHHHAQMEQVEIVVSGRALWEVGEIEREVGPGDVIFTPRFVKHGYKVLGDEPFKFYQVEWREWAQK